MRKLMMVPILAAALPASASWAPVSAAQLSDPNEAGVAMGHLHFNVRDVEANKKMWVALGGTLAKNVGDNEVIKIPGILIVLKKMEPTGGSAGTVVNHIGIKVPNVPATFMRMKAVGIKTEPGRTPHGGYFYSPEEMRIELVEDESMTNPI